MRQEIESPNCLRHSQVDTGEGLAVHVVEGGVPGQPAVVFVHGWPEDWTVFERIMLSLARHAHVCALDLPGIGASNVPMRANDKRSLAQCVHGLIRQLGLRDVTLVGHDCGGMIVYAYLHVYPGELARAVLMNTAVPGVDPWDEVRRNPAIWHFAFHAIAGLPEKLVLGRQSEYFGYFYDALGASPAAVDAQARRQFVAAYERPQALQTGFDWYRCFPQDERDNLQVKGNPVETPVLYLRGECEKGDMDAYLKGFGEGGLRNIRGKAIAGSGHFAPIEQAELVLTALRDFIELGKED